jgi:hypothetical protein
MENEIINNGGKKEEVQGYVTCGKDSLFSKEIIHFISFVLFLKNRTNKGKPPKTQS